MSDWNRGGPEDDARRYGFDDRREGRERSRRPDDRQDVERRSFEDRDQGYRSSARSYGSGERNYYPDRGSERPYRGQGSYRDEGYGWRNQGFQGSGAPPYDALASGGQGREERGYDPQRGQGGFAARNEPLQRITDGETDHGLRANLGYDRDRDRDGEHRGRGPKNYARSDERIREDVNDRLSDDSWLDASEIEVQVARCEVTLTGTVNDREDKRRAEDIAERVSGVKHVQNNLRVQPAGGQAAQF